MQELCGDVMLHHVRPGQRAREELFDLTADWTYLNHGSYGATVRYYSGPGVLHVRLDAMADLLTVLAWAQYAEERFHQIGDASTAR